MKHIIPVPNYALPQAWPFILELVEKGCKYSYEEYTPERLYADCMENKTTCYTLIDETICIGAGFISIVDGIAWGLLYATKTGKCFEEFDDLVGLLLEMLKKKGVTRFRFAGRVGWEKALQDYSPVTLYKVYEIKV